MIVKLGIFWNYAGIICHIFSGSIIHAWDVQLVCPDVWQNNKTVTLKAYVNKTSLDTKCTANPSNNTFFYLNGNPKCQVVPSQYACRYQEQVSVSTDVCDCSNETDTTYYVFIYQSLADEKLHNGLWDCKPSCTDSIGAGYFLTNENQKCDNVTVTKAVTTTSSPTTGTTTSSPTIDLTWCEIIAIVLGVIWFIGFILSLAIWCWKREVLETGIFFDCSWTPLSVIEIIISPVCMVIYTIYTYFKRLPPFKRTEKGNLPFFVCFLLALLCEIATVIAFWVVVSRDPSRPTATWIVLIVKGCAIIFAIVCFVIKISCCSSSNDTRDNGNSPTSRGSESGDIPLAKPKPPSSSAVSNGEQQPRSRKEHTRTDNSNGH